MEQKPNQDTDWEELGKTIEVEVRSAVGALTQAAQSVISTVAEQVRQGAAQVPPTAPYTGTAYTPKPQPKQKKKREKPINYGKKANAAASEAGGYVLVTGILTAVATGILFSDNTFPALMTGNLTAAMDDGLMPVMILGFIAVWFGVRAALAMGKAKALRRAAQYDSVLADRSFCTVAQLAAGTGKSEDAVRRDVRRLMENGLMEKVYLSPDGTRVFAGEMAYKLYLAHTQEKAAATQPAQPQQAAPCAPATVLEECRSFAAKLARQAELIDDAQVTSQVDSLAAHTKRIILWLEKHPEQESRVRRFASYYLPTTLKLLNTYNELAPHVSGGNVAAQSQREIADILQTINSAFQTLEDGLVRDTARDVSAEISALETVLAQEGLAQPEFETIKLP